MRTMRIAMGSSMRGLCLGAALALAACAPATVPQDNFYRLHTPAVATAFAKPPLPGTLEVERIEADGMIAARPIVYSDAAKPNQVGEYHYHFWTESPAALVQDALVEYLRGAGAAKMVVTPEVRVEPEYLLSGRLLRFEQVRGGSAKVVMTLEARLRETAADRLLLLKTYSVEVPAASDSVPAAVTAFDSALAQVFAALAKDIPVAR